MDDGQDLYCRRILVKLEQPTRDGETEIAVLTNLPQHGCVLAVGGSVISQARTAIQYLKTRQDMLLR